MFRNFSIFGLPALSGHAGNKSRPTDIPLFELGPEMCPNGNLLNHHGMLHRILTDVDYQNIGGRSRRRKVNKLMRNVWNLSLKTIVDVLLINAEIYKPIFTDLEKTVAKVVKEIADSRENIVTS